MKGFTVPNSCEVLAYGTKFQQQAFQYQNAYGIQFHPEVNLRMHLAWLYYAAYKLKRTRSSNSNKTAKFKNKTWQKNQFMVRSFFR